MSIDTILLAVIAACAVYRCLTLPIPSQGFPRRSPIDQWLYHRYRRKYPD